MNKSTNKERRLLIEIMEDLCQDLSNRGCVQILDDTYDKFSIEEKQQLMKEFEDWNSDGEEYDPKYYEMQIECFFSLMIEKLKKEWFIK